MYYENKPVFSNLVQQLKLYNAVKLGPPTRVSAETFVKFPKSLSISDLDLIDPRNWSKV